MIVLSALVALALAPARAAVKNPGTFTQLAIGDVLSLDPHWAAEAPGQRVIANVYETLLTYKPGGARDSELAPLLSERVPTRANGLISADGTVYRFPIRAGVRFHDGSLMTPEDARYSILRYMLQDRAGGNATAMLVPILGVASTREGGKPIPGLYARAARAVTVEKDALVIRLRRPYAPFLAVMATRSFVVSRRWCASHGQWDGGETTWERFNDPKSQDTLLQEDGTGPFLVERNDPATQEVVLKRFDGYWRAPARLERVVIKNVPEFSTRKLMLVNGDADAIFTLPSQRSQLQGLPGVTILDGYEPLVFGPFVLFNRRIDAAGNPFIGSGRLDGQGIPPDFFADPDVRRAFAASVDYARYAAEVQGGHQASGFIPPGMLGHDEDRPALRFDPAAAAESFKKAWGGRVWSAGFRFELPFHEGRDDFKALAQMIKSNIEALNPKFRVDLRPMQSSTMNARLSGRQLPLYVTSWGLDYPDPDDVAFPLLHSKGNYPARMGYGDAGTDAAVEQAAATIDPKSRAALYLKLQRAVLRDLPFIPTVEATRLRAQRSWTKGFVFRPSFPEMPQTPYFYDLWKAD